MEAVELILHLLNKCVCIVIVTNFKARAQSICLVSIRNAYALSYGLPFNYVLWRLVVWQPFHKAEVFLSHQVIPFMTSSVLTALVR